jgi:hypothetical protein
MSLDDLEKKLNKFAEEVEERLETFGKRIDESLGSKDSTEPEPRSGRLKDFPFWGIVLIIVGFVLLGNHLNWFDIDVPLIPTALIVIGLYLIIENAHKR